MVQPQLWFGTVTCLGREVPQLFEELAAPLPLVTPPPLPSLLPLSLALTTAVRGNGGPLPRLLVLLPLTPLLNSVALELPLGTLLHRTLSLVVGVVPYGPGAAVLAAPLLLLLLLLLETRTPLGYVPP